MVEQNEKIQQGDIRFDMYNQVHFYITNKLDKNVCIINNRLYTSNLDKNECFETKLIKHFENPKEGLIYFVENFCD